MMAKEFDRSQYRLVRESYDPVKNIYVNIYEPIRTEEEAQKQRERIIEAAQQYISRLLALGYDIEPIRTE